MPDDTSLTLALHIEGEVPDAGEHLAGVPEIASVDSVEASGNRDLATIATTLVTLTTIAANANALAATVDSLIANVVSLAQRFGWKKASFEVGRKTVDITDFTPEQQQHLREQLLAQAGGAAAPPATT